MQSMEWVENRFKDMQNLPDQIKNYSVNEINKVHHFHASMPQYDETPLYSMKSLSEMLGLSEIYIKDESRRFGLNAFKGLGVSYAMAKYFAGILDIDLNTLVFRELLEKVAAIPKITFATATDGNHGKGVAWASEIFGQQGKVYLPKGTAQSRLDAVLDFDAEGYITERNYDDLVQGVSKLAEENGWVHIQDTAWEGYTELPQLIMQGYTTMISEVNEQLTATALKDITHVILQAGVGSFAASVAAAVYNFTLENMPKIIIVEASKADCLYQSANSATGEPRRVQGDLDSMMAGLACGEPNPKAWEILKSISDHFISCADDISAKGMRVLGNPTGQDEKVVSGASGAVPVGFLYEVMNNEVYADLKEGLKLDRNSKILMINTEGNTDPVNYRRIVREEKV